MESLPIVAGSQSLNLFNALTAFQNTKCAKSLKSTKHLLPKQEKKQQPCELVPNSLTCSMILQLLKVIAIVLLRRDGLCQSLVHEDKIHTYSFTKNGREDKGLKESMYPISDLKFRKTISYFSQSAGKTVMKMGVCFRSKLY